MRPLLFRTHIWLGWIVGVQLLLWMASGLVMSFLPIETVRGEHLRAEQPVRPLPTGGLVAPDAILRSAAKPADSLTLGHLLDRPVYLLAADGKPFALFDAQTGERLAIEGEMATRIARAGYAGTGVAIEARPIASGKAVREFRRDAPAYAVRFDDADGTILYVHAVSGKIEAVRTGRWRFYDLMWGLHIMDWRGREDFNHPLLIAAALLGTVTVAGGLALLLLRLRGRRPNGGGKRGGSS
jgi:uncharacterized iron-regulated membrane protein